MTAVTTYKDDEGSFRNPDGFNIFCRYWKPEGAPKALLFLSHGYAEHCHDPRYNDLAVELTKNGFFVFAHDHVGHGKSEGPRGICNSVSVYVTDVLTHVDMMKAKYPGLPIIIYGHSMGGLITALAVVQRPNEFAAAVLCAPLLATDKAQASWLQVTVARILGRLVPSLPIGTLVIANAVKDPAVVKRMTEDPLRYHGYIRAGWAAAILTALDEIHEKYDAIQIPILIEHGTADKLCDIDGSEDAYKKIASKDKTFKVYKDCYHGLLHEPGGVGEQILQFTVSWCVQHITPSATPAVTTAVTPAVTAAVTPAATTAVTPAVSSAVTPAVAPAVTSAAAPAVTSTDTTAVTPPATTGVTPAVASAATPAVTPTVTPAAAPAMTSTDTPAVTPAATTGVTPAATSAVAPAVTPGTGTAVTSTDTPAVTPAATTGINPAAASAVAPAVTPAAATAVTSADTPAVTSPKT